MSEYDDGYADGYNQAIYKIDQLRTELATAREEIERNKQHDHEAVKAMEQKATMWRVTAEDNFMMVQALEARLKEVIGNGTDQETTPDH